MATRSAKEVMDTIIAKLESKLASARKIREGLDDPDIAEDLARAFGEALSPNSSSKDESDKPKLPRAGSQARKILEYFQKHNNQWYRLGEISDGIGVHKGAISAIMYTTNKHLFERSKDDDGAVVLRVIPDAMTAFSKEK